MCDKVVEKSRDTKAKANLKPPFYIREIDAKCPKGYRSLVKKDKENTYWEHRNEASKNKDKAKSHNSSFTHQPQTQASKKDKRGYRGGYPATEVNATEVAKKDKDKAKDLSHIKCYTCKQKGHYTNKCLEKSKN